MILIEGFQVLRNRVLVIEALRNHYRYGLLERHAAFDEEFEDIVEAGRIAHARLDDRRYGLYIAQSLA